MAPKSKGYDAERSVRYTKQLKERLEQIADQERRSVNDIIVRLLEEGVEKHGTQLSKKGTRN